MRRWVERPYLRATQVLGSEEVDLLADGGFDVRRARIEDHAIEHDGAVGEVDVGKLDQSVAVDSGSRDGVFVGHSR